MWPEYFLLCYVLILQKGECVKSIAYMASFETNINTICSRISHQLSLSYILEYFVVKKTGIFIGHFHLIHYLVLVTCL